MLSKNLANKRSQSKLTFIKLNDNKKPKTDSVKPFVTVDNVTELKGKQKETENIIDIPPSNWAKKTDKMLIEQTSTMIPTSENDSFLEKNLSVAISHDVNTLGTNQTKVLSQDKKTLLEEETFIRVLKVTHFFAMVTKIELEGNTTNKRITKL